LTTGERGNWEPIGIAWDHGRVRLTLPNGQGVTLAVGEQANGWIVRWVGGSETAPRAILETTYAEGGILLFWSPDSGARRVVKPRPGAYAPAPQAAFYGGHSLETVLTAGRDLLGDEVKAQGEPAYDRLCDLLPPIHGRRYQILGSPLSRGKYIIWPDGCVTTQAPRHAEIIYHPAQIDARVACCTVYDGLLDDWMPIACYRFEGDDVAYDLLAFVLPEDYAVAPTPFFRLSRYRKPDYRPLTDKCLRVTTWLDDEPPPMDFYAALDATVRFWWRWEETLAHVDLPEERAWRWTKGCLALAATTFCGDHPKYGGFWYAREEHDTFPPTLLNLAEAMLAWGAIEQSLSYVQYYLKHVVRIDGSFNYYGPSGTEYGQWLWLLDQIETQLGPQAWIASELNKVIATGRLLEALRQVLAGSALRLVQIGAEADNRHEVYTYFSNNLWAVRGLQAVARLAARHGRTTEASEAQSWADSLAHDVRQAIHAWAETTSLGPLIPSHIGYPADMWSLSQGPALPEAVPMWEQEAYLSTSRYVPIGFSQQKHAPRQWIRENTYANYRYHPEALSAMLLPPEHAEALVRLRQERGGQLLGMTRFMGWLDDWPVAAYARYLLSTDRVDDYLLLYYSHMAHHGNRETLTHYEQVTADGEVMAGDCVPCLLVIPLMTRWMLCFEVIGEPGLYLLRGVPRAWLDKGKRIIARGLTSSLGLINLAIEVATDYVDITVDLPAAAANWPVYMDLRLPHGRHLKETSFDRDWIEEIRLGYRLVIRPRTHGLHTARLAF
jgi:hypothetical protein